MISPNGSTVGVILRKDSGTTTTVALLMPYFDCLLMNFLVTAFPSLLGSCPVSNMNSGVKMVREARLFLFFLLLYHWRERFLKLLPVNLSVLALALQLYPLFFLTFRMVDNGGCPKFLSPCCLQILKRVNASVRIPII